MTEILDVFLVGTIAICFAGVLLAVVSIVASTPTKYK